MLLIAAVVFSVLTSAGHMQAGPSADQIEGYRRTLRSRLESDSLSFIAAKELFEFADRITPTIAAPARAEFELLRLRALGRAAAQIHRYEPADPGMRDFLKTHDASVVFSEPAGEWLVDAEEFWKLESKYRGNPIAEEIAWEAAQTGQPGECEGYIPCYFTIFLISEGRYLDLYPNGVHAAQAMDQIDYIVQEMLKPNNPYTIEKGDQKQLSESVTKVSAILQRTSVSKKTDVLARLKKVEQIGIRQ